MGVSNRDVVEEPMHAAVEAPTYGEGHQCHDESSCSHRLTSSCSQPRARSTQNHNLNSGSHYKDLVNTRLWLLWIPLWLLWILGSCGRCRTVGIQSKDRYCLSLTLAFHRDALKTRRPGFQFLLQWRVNSWNCSRTYA